jgi:hypothetical protein
MGSVQFHWHSIMPGDGVRSILLTDWMASRTIRVTARWLGFWTARRWYRETDLGNGWTRFMGSVHGLRSVHHAHEPRVSPADCKSALRGVDGKRPVPLALHNAHEPHVPCCGLQVRAPGGFMGSDRFHWHCMMPMNRERAFVDLPTGKSAIERAGSLRYGPWGSRTGGWRGCQ